MIVMILASNSVGVELLVIDTWRMAAGVYWVQWLGMLVRAWDVAPWRIEDWGTLKKVEMLPGGQLHEEHVLEDG